MIDPRNPSPALTADETPARIHPPGPSTPEPFPQAVRAGTTGSPAAQADALDDMAHAATLPREEDVTRGCPHCLRCEVLPRPVAGPGTVHFNFPHTHTLGKVLTWLVKGKRHHVRDGGQVSVPVGPDGMAALLPPLLDLLTPTEQRDTRAVFQHADQPLQMADLFAIEDLPTFAAKVSGGWLLDLMRDDRLTAHFQPILPADGKSVYGYECLLRGEAGGRVIPAGPMFDAARKADLIFQLDLAARRAALKAAAAHRLRTKVFVNFTPNAIYDAESCLDNTVRLVDELALSPGQAVFEMVEGERLPAVEHLVAIAAYYRRHGFEVAVDDLGAGYSSLQVLLAVRPDYVKLDMSLIRDVHADAGKAALAGKLLEAARNLGMRTVAEGVETADEWRWVRDHGADFVQGYYFARPAATPPAVLAATGA